LVKILVGERKLKKEVNELESQLQEVTQQKANLDRKTEILVEEVKFLRNVKETPIDSMLTVILEPNSVLLVAEKDSALIMPNGFRAFKISDIELLIDENEHVHDFWGVDRYITTEGNIAYIYGNDLLLEVRENEYVRVYQKMQEQIRENRHAIVKVTFPYSIPQDKIMEFLGIRVDPIVEVVFE